MHVEKQIDKRRQEENVFILISVHKNILVVIVDAYFFLPKHEC